MACGSDVPHEVLPGSLEPYRNLIFVTTLAVNGATARSAAWAAAKVQPEVEANADERRTLGVAELDVPRTGSAVAEEEVDGEVERGGIPCTAAC
jgi:hypothetical protein